MNVTLSRKVAQLMPFVPLAILSPAERLNISAAIDKTTTDNELPIDYQAMIAQAEKKVLPTIEDFQDK